MWQPLHIACGWPPLAMLLKQPPPTTKQRPHTNRRALVVVVLMWAYFVVAKIHFAHTMWMAPTSHAIKTATIQNQTSPPSQPACACCGGPSVGHAQKPISWPWSWRRFSRQPIERPGGVATCSYLAGLRITISALGIANNPGGVPRSWTTARANLFFWGAFSRLWAPLAMLLNQPTNHNRHPYHKPTTTIGPTGLATPLCIYAACSATQRSWRP